MANQSPYRPRITPSDFGPNVINRLFPLTPGTTLVYAGTKDDKPALNLVYTTLEDEGRRRR